MKRRYPCDPFWLDAFIIIGLLLLSGIWVAYMIWG